MTTTMEHMSQMIKEYREYHAIVEKCDAAIEAADIKAGLLPPDWRLARRDHRV